LGLRPNWNAGILGKWVLGYWIVGLMVREDWTIKFKIDLKLKSRSLSVGAGAACRTVYLYKKDRIPQL
jgi:hypothetical protein